MKTNIDAKSALLGLLAGVVVTFAMGAGVTSDRFGRYQLTGTDTHAVMVDTATGQAWSSYFAPGSGRNSPDFFETKKTDARR